MSCSILSYDAQAEKHVFNCRHLGSGICPKGTSIFLSYDLLCYPQAPITEEIVFRACVIAVYHMSGASTKRMIFLGPLSFGLGMSISLFQDPLVSPSIMFLFPKPAHVHHAWDTFNRYGRTANAAKRAVIMSRASITMLLPPS